MFVSVQSWMEGYIHGLFKIEATPVARYQSLVLILNLWFMCPPRFCSATVMENKYRDNLHFDKIWEEDSIEKNINQLYENMELKKINVSLF